MRATPRRRLSSASALLGALVCLAASRARWHHARQSASSAAETAGDGHPPCSSGQGQARSGGAEQAQVSSSLGRSTRGSQAAFVDAAPPLLLVPFGSTQRGRRGSTQTLSPRVGPSVLAGDLSNIAAEARRVVRAGADFVHLDVFDGVWVKGAFSFGPMVVRALRPHVPHAYLDVHLCVNSPEQYVEELASAGVNRMTFHYEAVSNPKALAEKAHGLGMEVGLALAPVTVVDSKVLDLAQFFDVVLVMTVEPGFGGQAFKPQVLPKLATLRAAYPNKALEVDGGINLETITAAAAAGATEAVAGTSVFKARNPAKVIRKLREGLQASQSQ